MVKLSKALEVLLEQEPINKEKEANPEIQKQTPAIEQPKKETPKVDFKKPDPPKPEINAIKPSNEVKFEYSILDEHTNTIVGETGSKTILITKENYDKVATVLWDSVVKTADINLLKARQSGTSVNFVLNTNFSLSTNNYNFIIRFKIDEEKFTVNGWSFGNVTSASSSLDDLNTRLGKIFSTLNIA